MGGGWRDKPIILGIMRGCWMKMEHLIYSGDCIDLKIQK